MTIDVPVVYIKCMAYVKLQSEDRNFFTLVSEATFTNPFSEHWDELKRKISSKSYDVPWRKMAHELVREIEKRISYLDKDRPAKISDFQQSDRNLLEHVFVFKVYFQFIEEFEELIDRQFDAGDEPVTVPFARDVLSQLTARGFAHSAANKYFSLIYQTRRAARFIGRRLIGTSPSMRMLRMNLWNNIFTHDIHHYERYLWNKMEDFSTLLLGPTGCGKGAAAAAIGRSGFIPYEEKKNTFADSFTRMFIPINLSQYPETLVESELFGHKKGAFTGAVTDHKGLFAMCGNHSSVFLDEIGDTSIQVQIKLLQILQDRIFSPVGSHKNEHFKGRVIAATNKSIDELRLEGRFRDDFYYRLCSDCILVPSLKQRIDENPSEINELISDKVEQITGHKAPEIDRTVKEVIDTELGKDYHWPGNVRELEQCIRRVIIKRSYQGDKMIKSMDEKRKLFSDIESGSLSATRLLTAYCQILYSKYGTYQDVARITGLDRRTVKKHIDSYSA